MAQLGMGLQHGSLSRHSMLLSQEKNGNVRHLTKGTRNIPMDKIVKQCGSPIQESLPRIRISSRHVSGFLAVLPVRKGS
jgi:hypothetical protein